MKSKRTSNNRTIGYFEGLDGFLSLDPRWDIQQPYLPVTDTGTIWSQGGQSYTQYVPMHDPDSAMTILPIGPSERPDSPFRFSTLADWSRGELHPAPLSRAAVEDIAVMRTALVEGKMKKAATSGRTRSGR